MTSDVAGPSPRIAERVRRAWMRLRGGALSPGRAAASVGIGLFVACIPLYGVQFLIVLALCLPLRLDAALAYIVAHVSNPLTLPVFLWLELQIGSRILTGHFVAMHFEDVKRLGLATVGTQIAVGAATSAVALGGAGALLTWVVAHRVRDARHKDLAEARHRVLARYAGASRRARSYVSIKLRTDPALAAIAALDGHFGRVVDAGCGYLQLGLTLFELGRVTSLAGYDASTERVEVARVAAGADAHVEQADLRAVVFPEADTVLFVDSLHYLPLDAQEDVLARAVAALAPGGRIVVREVDHGASLRSRFTEHLERNAAKKRAAANGLAFRSAAEIATLLERLGLTCSIAQHEDLSIVHNALVVGRR